MLHPHLHLRLNWRSIRGALAPVVLVGLVLWACASGEGGIRIVSRWCPDRDFAWHFLGVYVYSGCLYSTRALVVVIPFWLPISLSALATLCGLYSRWARAARANHLQRGLCPRCGYDLRASPDRCPECGTATGA